MAKQNSIALISLYFVILLASSFIPFLCDANNSESDTKTYIIYLGSLSSVPKELSSYSPTSHHLSILQQVSNGGLTAINDATSSLIRSYTKSFNGFAAKLTSDQRDRIAEMDEVVSVFESKKLRIQTTRSWDFMGFVEKTIKRNSSAESDVVVGVIDTGVWPESESFSDEGLSDVPEKWRGTCAGGKNFTCNKKIIGARFYSERRDSARDEHGHGTHTASIAAGNIVDGVSFYGLANGTARGGVPFARIATYAACDSENGNCEDKDILAAFDDAISDGVTIISASVGGLFIEDFLQDSIAIGSFHAMEKGILTVHAAGNAGPASSTVVSLAPWILTVAASSTDRRIIDKLVLGDNNGTTLVGNSINVFNSNGTEFPIAKMYDSLPIIDSYINSTKDPKAEIKRSEIVKDENAPRTFKISSRGPNYLVPEILKPDISAPGVDILAAYSPVGSVSSFVEDKRSVNYNFLTGTSMACPHVSGISAYLKTVHPNWSPAAIKSAILTTAKPMKKSYSEDAVGEFEYGSGHVNPVQASDPGLVYDISKEDYVEMLCNFGYNSSQIKMISGNNNSTCPRSPQRELVKNLNYPILGVNIKPLTAFKVEFERTVTNVGFANSTYKASVVLSDSHGKVNITVEPKVLSFKSLNEKMSFVVSVAGEGISNQTAIASSLIWSDGTHNVRSPIIVMGFEDLL
ncbi:LOW QUALITY PROTEIN: subtilisin-like protease SBT4.3 [Neltuma alba]|uniref:LOW QUALITY PROTEIN: subtilisin-like protease SBT4.3 n=1 Tax=Neltuma alba TaxID=207710 RepID=UPI0010A5657D|nr:LOW QUALITY PROTEIN: subtilisin-like protease SBT4.3 [Prosopis alba]